MKTWLFLVVAAFLLLPLPSLLTLGGTVEENIYRNIPFSPSPYRVIQSSILITSVLDSTRTLAVQPSVVWLDTPVLWQLDILKGEALSRVFYTTPPIYKNSKTDYNGTSWQTKIYLHSEYGGIYQNVTFIEDIPSTQIVSITSGTSGRSDINSTILSGEQIQLTLPSFQRDEIIIIDGFDGNLNLSTRQADTPLGIFRLTSDVGIISEMSIDPQLELYFRITGLYPGQPAKVSLLLPFEITGNVSPFFWKDLFGNPVEVPLVFGASRSEIILPLQDGVIDKDQAIDGGISGHLNITGQILSITSKPLLTSGENISFKTSILNIYNEKEELLPINIEINPAFLGIAREIEEDEYELEKLVENLTNLKGSSALENYGVALENLPEKDFRMIKEKKDEITLKKIAFERNHSDGMKVEIAFEDLPVKNIRFKDLIIRNNTISIGIKELNTDETIQGYAIDPEQLEFTEAEVTATAKGNRLYKCAEWDFEAEICSGEWVLFKTDLSPGEEYNFILTPDDPGFREILVETVVHLDENRTFLSDIYEEVKNLDDVWSEEIPPMHYVRLRFERNLTSANDITIFPDIASGTPRIEIYAIGNTTPIAEFTAITPYEYNKVYLTNLVGEQDSFDLLIIDGSVKFDHIIDPSSSVVDNTSLSIWDNNDGNSSLFNGNLSKYAGTQIEFYANYTNATNGNPITGADCAINYSSNPTDSYTMQYNSSTGLYVANSSFAVGNYTYDITCGADNFAVINLSDTLNVEEDPTYMIIACGTISSPGEYFLTGPITSAGTCLTITADNIEIDCRGNSITYDTGGVATRMGINAIDGANPRTNLTVKNCVIEKPVALQTAGYGISLTRFSNSFIINNTIRTNGTTYNYGILLTTLSSNNLIQNNSINAMGTGAGNAGLYILSDSTNNTVRGNSIYTTGTTTNYGIWLSTNSHNTLLENNYIYTDPTTGGTNSDAYGIYGLTNIQGTQIVNNTILTHGRNLNYGIYFAGGFSNTLITQNTIYSGGVSTNHAIYLLGTTVFTGYNTTITYNTLSPKGTTTNNYGIYLSSNINLNYVSNNIISTGGTSGGIGIALTGNTLGRTVNENTISDNNISTNGSAGSNIGIYLATEVNNNNITNNNIVTNGTTGNYGIHLLGTTLPVTNSVISGNTILTGGSGASNFGVHLYDNINSTLIGNNLITTSGTSTNYGIYLRGTGLSVNLNTIRDNSINAGGSVGTNYGIYFNTRTSSNTVLNNNVSTFGTTANYGIIIAGAATGASNNNNITSNNVDITATTTNNFGIYLATNANNNEISYNTVRTTGSSTNYGIQISGDTYVCSNNSLLSNDIATVGTAGTNNGIYLYRNVTSTTISGNTITTSGTTGDSGIYAVGTATEPIDNNLVDTNTITAYGSAAAGVNYGIYFATNANSNTIRNNKVSTSGTTANYGISFVGAATGPCNNNNITQNNVTITATTTNNWGIYLATNANSNEVSNNLVSTTGTSTNHGLYINGATYPSVANILDSNTVQATGTIDSNYGIYLNSNINGTTVSRNNVTTSGTINNYGIYAVGTAALPINHNHFTDNHVSASGTSTGNHGLYFVTNVNNNTVSGNTILSSGTGTSHGILLSTSLGLNTFSNNQVSATGPTSYGAYLFTAADNNTFSGNNISGVYGYALLSSSNNLIRDCVGTAGTTTDVYVDLDITPRSLNNTFLNCTYETESVAGAGNYLTRQWYFDAIVNNTLGYLENASVNASNITGGITFSQTTDSSGTIPQQRLTEYYAYAANKILQTPHTFVVSKLTYTSNETTYNLSITKNLVHIVTLKGDTTPPNIAIKTPQNSTYISSMLLLNISVIEDNLDTIWYNWEGINQTYTQPVTLEFPEGSTTIHAWANDTGGNSNYTNVSFTVDLLELQIISPVATTYRGARQLVNISTSEVPVDTIWYNWNGTNITYTGPVNVTFAPGNNTLFAWANDSLGNIVSTNVTFFSESAEIAACGTISAPGLYILSQDIESTGTCLTITGNNIYIQCDGHTITYGTSGAAANLIGINAINGTTQMQNLTVRDCIIQKPNNLQGTNNAIRLTRYGGSSIVNNTLYTNGTTNNYGIYLTTNSGNNLIENNTINSYGTSTGNAGIYILSGSSDNTIRDNLITSTGTTTSYSIWVSTGSHRTRIERNTVSAVGTSTGTYTDSYGIYLTTGIDDSVVTDNTVSTSGTGRNYGIYFLNNFSNTQISRNNVNTSGTTLAYGIYLAGATGLPGTNNQITGNNVRTIGTTTNNYGIYLYLNVNQNNVSHNTISTYGTSGGIGISLIGGTLSRTVNDNIILDNNISTGGTAGGNIGIYLATEVNNNNISNNRISTGGVGDNYGIQLLGTTLPVTNSAVFDNTISTNGSSTNNYGIYLFNNINGTSLRNNLISTFGTSTNHGIHLSGSGLSLNRNTVTSNTIHSGGTIASNYGIYLYYNMNENNITHNNITTSGTTTNHGIYAVGTATQPVNNNIVDTNTIATSGSGGITSNYGIYFTTNANRNTIRNNNVSTSGTTANYGISLVGTATGPCNSNNITSNDVGITATTTNNWGIYLATNANSNEVSNNQVSTSGTSTNHGLYINGATYPSLANILDSNIVQASGTIDSNYGIYLNSNINGTTVSRNNVSTTGTINNHGIYAAGTAALPVNHNHFTDNEISASGTGTGNNGLYFLTNVNNNTVSGNTILSSGTGTSHGILLSTSLGLNTFSNNQVSATGPTSYGAYLFTAADNNTFSGNNISGVYGYALLSSSNNLIRDCVGTAGTTTDVYVDLDITPRSLNNTFLNCTYETESVAGAGNYLLRQWYFDAVVNDSMGYLENANVSGFNVTASLLFADNTSAQGTISTKILDEYTNLQGTRSYDTPHVVTVKKPLYTTNTSTYNLSLAQNILHAVTLDLDIIPPNIIIHTPENRTYNTQNILLNITVTDDNLDTVWYNWNGTNYTYTSPINITFTEGVHTLHAWANDTPGNTNYTNVTFDLRFPDLVISNIISDAGQVEAETQIIQVNVTNNGTYPANGLIVELNISLWNGTWVLVHTNISQPLNLSENESVLVNFSFISMIGTQEFNAYADVNDDVFEIYESNNQYFVNFTIEAWELFYGKYDYNLVLISQYIFMNWSTANLSGTIYYSDSDSDYNPTDLRPLNGAGYLALADTSLGMTYFNDSLTRLYDLNTDGWPDSSANISVAGTTFLVPVINSSLSSTFITGIMYDSGDGADYTGANDLVFITVLNLSKPGKYGTYDYEIRLPSRLENLKGTLNQVTRIDEVS